MLKHEEKVVIYVLAVSSELAEERDTCRTSHGTEQNTWVSGP